MTETARPIETTGVNFVLYATDEERRAIKAVNLFFDCAEVVARMEGLDMLHLHMSVIHKRFPEFARELLLHRSQNYAFYYSGNDNKCPAVNLHNRAYNSSDSENLAHILYFHQPVDLERMRGGIIERIYDIAPPRFELNYEKLIISIRALIKRS